MRQAVLQLTRRSSASRGTATSVKVAPAGAGEQAKIAIPVAMMTARCLSLGFILDLLGGFLCRGTKPNTLLEIVTEPQQLEAIVTDVTDLDWFEKFPDVEHGSIKAYRAGCKCSLCRISHDGFRRISYKPVAKLPPAIERGWEERAACKGKDWKIFYPQVSRPHDELAQSHAAKKICAKCPVLRSCAETALTNREPHGIWGGLATIEREAIRQQRRAS